MLKMKCRKEKHCKNPPQIIPGIHRTEYVIYVGCIVELVTGRLKKLHFLYFRLMNTRPIRQTTTPISLFHVSDS